MPRTRADRTLPKGLHEKPPGSGNFYSTFYDKTRQPKVKWVTLGVMTREAAEIEHKRLRTLYSLGEYDPWKPKPVPDDPTSAPFVSEAIDAFLQARNGLAPNTIKNKRSTLDLFLKQLPRRRRVSDVTAEDVKRFLESPGHKASTQTQKGWILSGFFAWCQDQGYREGNPARDYMRVRGKNLSAYDRRRKNASQPRAAIMPTDLRRILSAVHMAGLHSPLYDIFRFAVGTGIRRDELCHLCHRDVYLDPPPSGLDWPVTGRIRVRCWDHPYNGKRFRTKNGKDRTVPLTPLAARIAAQHLSAHVTEDDYAPVFRGVKGGRIQKEYLTRWFKHYREAIGLSDRLTFHSLRHAYASYLLMLGANVLTIKRILGHSTLAELDHYAELAEDYLMGDARPLQRQMLLLLCPDLPEPVLDRVLPSKRSLLGVLSGESYSRAQHLQAIIPIEDVLFSGLVYEIEQQPTSPSFLESF